jgi:dTDP-4-amino-4,6-dideoxygalactose transaminase
MDKIIESKRKVAKLYKENLQNIEEITLRNEPDFAYSVYQAFVVLVPSFKIRNKIISEMKKFDIGMQIGTYSSYIQPVYQTSDKCPNSFDVFNRALALPFYDTMKENEVLEVTEKLRRILK